MAPRLALETNGLAFDSCYWQNTSLSAAVRAQDMLKRMTIEQKAASLSQQVGSFDMTDGSGTVRQIYNAECLHGPHNQGYTSTVFPIPIALAATLGSTAHAPHESSA